MGKRWKLASGLLAVMGLATCLTSCTQADAVKAASMIHAYLPTVVGLVNDAAGIAEGLDPAAASAVLAVNAKVQADLQQLEAVSGAYSATPTASVWSEPWSGDGCVGERCGSGIVSSAGD